MSRPGWVDAYTSQYLDGLGSDLCAWDTYTSTLVGGNYRLRNSLSSKRIYTTADSITVKAWSTQTTYPGIGVVDVYVNGVFVQSIACTANTVTTATVTLPFPGTQQLVEVFDSANNAGLIASVRLVNVPDGHTYAAITPSAPAVRLVLVTESRTLAVTNDGVTFGDSRRLSIAGLLRDTFAGRVANVGYGGDSLNAEYVAGGNSMAPLAAQTNALCDGTTRNIVLYNLIYNDRGNANFATQLASYVAGLRPDIEKIGMQSFVSGSDTSSLDASVASIFTAAPNGRTIVPRGGSWPDLTMFPDDVHGNEAMHATATPLIVAAVG
jgi:hypothetical protein